MQKNDGMNLRGVTSNFGNEISYLRPCVDERQRPGPIEPSVHQLREKVYG